MGRTSTAELAAQCTMAAYAVCAARDPRGVVDTVIVATEAVAMAQEIESDVEAIGLEQGVPAVEPLPAPTREPGAVRSLVRGVFDANARKWLREAGVVNLVLWVSEDGRRLIQVEANNAYIGRDP